MTEQESFNNALRFYADNLSEVAPKIRFILETANKNREYFYFYAEKHIMRAGQADFNRILPQSQESESKQTKERECIGAVDIW